MLVVVVGAATVALAMTLPTAALTGGTAAPAVCEADEAPTVVPPSVEPPRAEPLAAARPSDVVPPVDELGQAVGVGEGATATTGIDGLAPGVRTVSEPLSSLFTTCVGLGAGVGVATGVGGAHQRGTRGRVA